MLRIASIAQPPCLRAAFLLPEEDCRPLQEIAWVLGQVTAEGITNIIHAFTWHGVAVRVLGLVTFVVVRLMSKPDRLDSTR